MMTAKQKARDWLTNPCDYDYSDIVESAEIIKGLLDEHDALIAEIAAETPYSSFYHERIKAILERNRE